MIQTNETTSKIIPIRTVDSTEATAHTVCDVSLVNNTGSLIFTIRAQANFSNAEFYITVRYTKK
jgi:hypothetical protein